MKLLCFLFLSIIFSIISFNDGKNLNIYVHTTLDSLNGSLVNSFRESFQDFYDVIISICLISDLVIVQNPFFFIENNVTLSFGSTDYPGTLCGIFHMGETYLNRVSTNDYFLFTSVYRNDDNDNENGIKYLRIIDENTSIKSEKTSCFNDIMSLKEALFVYEGLIKAIDNEIDKDLLKDESFSFHKACPDHFESLEITQDNGYLNSLENKRNPIKETKSPFYLSESSYFDYETSNKDWPVKEKFVSSLEMPNQCKLLWPLNNSEIFLLDHKTSKIEIKMHLNCDLKAIKSNYDFEKYFMRISYLGKSALLEINPNKKYFYFELAGESAGRINHTVFEITIEKKTSLNPDIIILATIKSHISFVFGSLLFENKLTDKSSLNNSPTSKIPVFHVVLNSMTREEGFPHLLNSLNLTGYAVEVGVREGQFSVSMLSTWLGAK